jgi:hypothetical protein
MAGAPVQTVPDVSPGGPPADYQNIQANPAQFGGLVAQGEKSLGQGVQQGGGDLVQTALLKQERFNQIGATEAFNQLQSTYHTLTYGVPGDPSQRGIYGLRGADALRAGPVIQQQMEDARNNIRGNLNDAQKLMFDQGSRRLQMFTLDAVGRHLDAQADVYGNATNQATENNQRVSITSQWNDATNFNHSLEEWRTAAVQNAQLKFGSNPDPAIIKSELSRVASSAVKARIEAWAPNDPVAASQWLETGVIPEAGTGRMIPIKQAIDPATYFTLSRELKGASDAATVDGGVQDITNSGGVPRSATHASTYDIDRAIHGQESGGAATAPTSVDGSVGGHQIQPATFAQYARPGEDITNSSDNATVGKRIVADLSQKYANDPARVAVAYFSGPGNVAPPGSPTPWVQDKKDGNGTSTSSYVSGVLRRLGVAPTPGSANGNPLSANGQPTAREGAIPSRYFDDMRMMQQAYTQAQTMRPDLGKRLIDGVFEHIQRENSLENQAESRADHDLTTHQRDNESILFGAVVQGQPMTDAYLGNLVRTQQISPSGYNAIKAVQQKQADGADDPLIVARLWDGIGSDKVSSDDVFNGLTAGKINAKTADEMIRSLNTRRTTQTNAVERGAYDTLKTALGGHALESGMLDIFGEGKKAQAQLWTQAQGEWNKRVIVGKEDPQAVLADMMPRYEKAIPDKPSAWPNPRFGAVQSIQDVATVAAKTKAAFQAGQISQDTYNTEGDLLARYSAYFQQADARKAAVAKAGVPARGSRPAPPLAPAASE